jgi:hypothetical protein
MYLNIMTLYLLVNIQIKNISFKTMHTWKQDNIAFTLLKMDRSNDITTRIGKKREHILTPTSSQFYTPLQYMHIIKYCVNLLTFQWKHTPIKTTQTCKQHPTAFTLYKENTCFITLVPWIEKGGTSSIFFIL